MKAAAQIFLSYAREDEERIEKLYQGLSEAGFKPWMAKKDILGGEFWERSIDEAIRHSDFFLAFLSANSIGKRGWIQKEIKQALAILQKMLPSDLYLIPVRLEDCKVPESLRDIQWVDLFEDDGWIGLVRAIQVGMERRATGIKLTPKEGPEQPMAALHTEEVRFLEAKERQETLNKLAELKVVVPIWKTVRAIAGVMAVLIALGAWLVPNVAEFLPNWIARFETTTVTPTSSPTHTPVISTATPVSPTDTLTSIPPTPTPVPPTVTATNTPSPTATPTPTATTTNTPSPTDTPLPTATDTPGPPPPTPLPTTAVPQPGGPVALTIYLRDTRTETGFAALSGDQVNGGMIYEEGHFVYGEAAVRIGDTVYQFDKPEVEPGEPEQLPDPWRVEFEFAEELVARTGNQAGFDPKKAQFWVGALGGDSAVGEESPYSLTMKLYEGNELRKSIQVFFTVADAPGPGPGPEGTPGKPTMP